MKYFSPSYWFKLWVLSVPLFNNKIQGINTKSIDSNQKIKDWSSNNINLESINQNMSFANSNTNYQLNNLSQALNQNINPFYQTELETSTHKHYHEKHKNRLKRTLKGGNEIESGLDYFYGSFKPEFWEEIVKIYFQNSYSSFIDKFKNKTYDYYNKNDMWIDWRISWNGIKNYAKGLHQHFEKISNIFENSSRKERIRIVINDYISVDNKNFVFCHQISCIPSFFRTVDKTDLINANIRTDDSSYYPNIYLDNLQRDFPIWNSYITINLGIINENIDNDIRQAINQKYFNFNVSQISIEKTNYSLWCSCYEAKLKINANSYYSYGKTNPIFTYITQTKLNEISNIIINDKDIKKWINDINYWNSTLPQAIESAKAFTSQALYNWKRQECINIQNYIARWNIVARIINNELKLDELNKNVRGLKSSFDSIKNQINKLEKRVTNLENKSNLDCANTIGFADAVINAVPFVGTISSAIARITSGVCAIAGV